MKVVILDGIYVVTSIGADVDMRLCTFVLSGLHSLRFLDSPDFPECLQLLSHKWLQIGRGSFVDFLELW